MIRLLKRKLHPAVEQRLVDNPSQFGIDGTSTLDNIEFDPLTDTDEIPNVAEDMLAEYAELEQSFEFDEVDPLAETQIAPAATIDQIDDPDHLGLPEGGFDQIELPSIVNDIDTELPTPTSFDDPTSDELNDALAWLKNVADGSDASLDEMTVELDQEDVAKLLEEHLAKSNKSNDQSPLTTDAPEDIVQESDEAHSEHVAEELTDDSSLFVEDAGSVETYEDGPTLVTDMPEIDEAMNINEPTKIERFGDSGELDEALAWLEAFTNDEPVIDPKGNLAAEAFADTFSDDTVAPAYESERVLAHKAFREKDFAGVARAYGAVLTQGDPLGADMVVRDVKEWVKTASDQPNLFRLLGEGHLQLKQFELSALAYRRALELL